MTTRPTEQQLPEAREVRASVSRARAAVRAGTRRDGPGFTLFELLIVVVLVGILAVMAAPAMVKANYERRVYDDAGKIMQIYREARTRAIARGSAVMVAATQGGTNAGTFAMWEAVQQAPGGAAATNAPASTCRTPQVWSPVDTANVRILFLDQANLNGTAESGIGITTQIIAPGGAARSSAYICFTPLGRAYYVDNTATPNFDGVLPMNGVLQIVVYRQENATAVGIARTVLIPPSGVSRVQSVAAPNRPIGT